MAKIVDITDKLTFEGNPSLKIKGRRLELNADAPTMLKVMVLMGEEVGGKEIYEAYNLIFTEQAKKEIEKMKLKFKDLTTVVREAIGLITGNDEEPGEQ